MVKVRIFSIKFKVNKKKNKSIKVIKKQIKLMEIFKNLMENIEDR